MTMAAPTDLVDPGRVTAALEAAGLRAAGAAPLVLDRAWPDARAGLLALYRGPAEEARPEWWTLLPLPDRGPSGSLRRALRGGRAAFVPSLSALALKFPEDARLPRLAEALDAGAALARLSCRLPAGLPRPDRVRPQPIAYRPMRRCAVRYALGGAPGDGALLYAKCYRPGADAAVLALHASLRGAGADPREAVARPDQAGAGLDEAGAGRRPAGWRVARPCLHIPEWSLLAWRPEPGESFHARLGRPGAGAAARAVGAALGGLHGSAAGWSRPHTIEDEWRTVSRWAAAATRAFPHAAAPLRRAAAAWSSRAAGLPPGPLVPAHRDFHDKQILLDGRGAVILDLDLACRAAPELDLANLLAHLRLRRLQGRLADGGGLRDPLLDGYARVAGRPDPIRLGFYEASALMRLACVYAFRPRWDVLSDLLLEEALERFDARAAPGGDRHAHPMDPIPAAGRPRGAAAAGRRG
jgi:hypothetical protein